MLAPCSYPEVPERRPELFGHADLLAATQDGAVVAREHPGHRAVYLDTMGMRVRPGRLGEAPGRRRHRRPRDRQPGKCCGGPPSDGPALVAVGTDDTPLEAAHGELRDARGPGDDAVAVTPLDGTRPQTWLRPTNED